MSKKSIGIIILSLINCFVLLMIVGYINIACSTISNNIFHVKYETSGIQMLYYLLNLPLFIIATILNIAVNSWLRIKKLVAINIMLVWLSFYGLLEFSDRYIHFPKANNLFYQGSLLIATIGFFIAIMTLIFQLKEIKDQKY